MAAIAAGWKYVAFSKAQTFKNILLDEFIRVEKTCPESERENRKLAIGIRHH
jgi:hypothetical protein